MVTSILGPMPVYAQDFVLPAPGQMVGLSPAYNPVVLKGIKIDPHNPFRFHFYVDMGDLNGPGTLSSRYQVRSECAKLIKYFLASLTIPENDLWVNLSPYEKNRIVPQEFGQTEMGRDLLAEDYILKQITASLIYPESQLGKEFWNKVYAQAEAKYGTTNIPINTFNKVWIVPDKAVVYENNGTAFVLENHLKVMLEEDYLSLQKHKTIFTPGVEVVHSVASEIIREIVIPELTKEVNEGKNFSQLRQVFYSLILAIWYKKKIKDSIFNKIYLDRNKTQGLVIPAKAGIHNKNNVEYIYQQYLQAFKKGVYNYIKEEPDQITGQRIPRKYFSGGVVGSVLPRLLEIEGPGKVNRAQLTAFSKEPIVDIDGAMAVINQIPKATVKATMNASANDKVDVVSAQTGKQEKTGIPRRRFLEVLSAFGVSAAVPPQAIDAAASKLTESQVEAFSRYIFMMDEYMLNHFDTGQWNGPLDVLRFGKTIEEVNSIPWKELPAPIGESLQSILRIKREVFDKKFAAELDLHLRTGINYKLEGISHALNSADWPLYEYSVLIQREAARINYYGFDAEALFQLAQKNHWTAQQLGDEFLQGLKERYLNAENYLSRLRAAGINDMTSLDFEPEFAQVEADWKTALKDLAHVDHRSVSLDPTTGSIRLMEARAAQEFNKRRNLIEGRIHQSFGEDTVIPKYRDRTHIMPENIHQELKDFENDSLNKSAQHRVTRILESLKQKDVSDAKIQDAQRELKGLKPEEIGRLNINEYVRSYIFERTEELSRNLSAWSQTGPVQLKIRFDLDGKLYGITWRQNERMSGMSSKLTALLDKEWPSSKRFTGKTLDVEIPSRTNAGAIQAFFQARPWQLSGNPLEASFRVKWPPPARLSPKMDGETNKAMKSDHVVSVGAKPLTRKEYTDLQAKSEYEDNIRVFDSNRIIGGINISKLHDQVHTKIYPKYRGQQGIQLFRQTFREEFARKLVNSNFPTGRLATEVDRVSNRIFPLLINETNLELRRGHLMRLIYVPTVSTVNSGEKVIEGLLRDFYVYPNSSTVLLHLQDHEIQEVSLEADRGYKAYIEDVVDFAQTAETSDKAMNIGRAYPAKEYSYVTESDTNIESPISDEQWKDIIRLGKSIQILPTANENEIKINYGVVWPDFQTPFKTVDRKLGILDAIKKAALKHPDQPVVVLDLGCGDATTLRELRKALPVGLKVILLGYADQYYPSWQNVPGEDHIIFYFDTLDRLHKYLNPKSIDIIYSNYSIWHWFTATKHQERAKTIDELKRLMNLLKDGGQFFNSPVFKGEAFTRIINQVNDVHKLIEGEIWTLKPVTEERMTRIDYTQLQYLSHYLINWDMLNKDWEIHGIKINDVYKTVQDEKFIELRRIKFRSELGRLLFDMNFDPKTVHQIVDEISGKLFHLDFDEYNLGLRKGKFIQITYRSPQSVTVPVFGILTDFNFDRQKHEATVVLDGNKSIVISLLPDTNHENTQPEIDDVVKIIPETDMAMSVSGNKLEGNHPLSSELLKSLASFDPGQRRKSAVDAARERNPSAVLQLISNFIDPIGIKEARESFEAQFSGKFFDEDYARVNARAASLYALREMQVDLQDAIQQRLNKESRLWLEFNKLNIDDPQVNSGLDREKDLIRKYKLGHKAESISGDIALIESLRLYYIYSLMPEFKEDKHITEDIWTLDAIEHIFPADKLNNTVGRIIYGNHLDILVKKAKEIEWSTNFLKESHSREAAAIRQDLEHRHKLGDKAMKTFNKGGIDLNPVQMSMEIKNGPESKNGDSPHFLDIDPAQVAGVSFTIRTMTPVKDLPQLLGLK